MQENSFTKMNFQTSYWMFVNENETLFSVNEGHGVFVHVIWSSLLQLGGCLQGGGEPQVGKVTR